MYGVPLRAGCEGSKGWAAGARGGREVTCDRRGTIILRVEMAVLGVRRQIF